MRLIDHHKVVVAPVDTVEPDATGLATSPGEVRVGKHVVVEPVRREDVRRQIGVVVRPVLGELLRGEHQDRLVAQFVILDDRERGEGLSEANAVREDAAVVGLEFVDDAGGCVLLEVVEAVPDSCVLVSRAVVRENVLADVVQEVVKNVVENEEIDAFRGVLGIHGRDVIVDEVGDLSNLCLIGPDLVEEGYETCGGGCHQLVNHVGDGVAGFVPEVSRRKALDGHVGSPVVHRRELLHGPARAVGPELDLVADPLSALACNGALGQFVTQPDLEVGAVEAGFSLPLRDEELATLLAKRVC